MLLALTVERYVSVCRPGQHTRPLCGPPHLTVALIPLATFIIYLPSAFRGQIATCLLEPGGHVVYQKRENQSYLDSMFYQVLSTRLRKRNVAKRKLVICSQMFFRRCTKWCWRWFSKWRQRFSWLALISVSWWSIENPASVVDE